MSEEKAVQLELTKGEIFQLGLSVGHRMSGLTQLLANALTEEESNQYQVMISYLERLHFKLNSYLNGGDADADSTRKKAN